MKNNTEEIDKLIKETLTQEEAKFYDELDEQNVFQMFIGVFSGKNKWLIIIMNIINLIVFGFLIYSLIQFFNAIITNELIKWGIGIVICVSFISMMKLYAWMQMDKNALLRELKRLELQVSSLSGKML